MAERYTRIYTLPGSLYTESSPVLIVAGALLKDNQTGKMLAQLKIQNLEESVVTGISLSLVLFDAEGKQITNPFEHQFSRISVEENSYFGQKEPIILPAGDIHSYQVSVQSVYLSNGTVWKSEKDWYTLPPDTSIADIKQSLNMLRQKEAEEKQRELEKKQRELEELEQRKKEEAEADAALEKQRKAEHRKKILKISPIVAVVVIIIAVIIANICKANNERDRLRREELAVRDTISAGGNHVVGLKADGTVVADGNNDYGQCNVSNWTGIIAISAGLNHTVGLKADGTVVAVGDNGSGECNVDDWTDIIAISAGCEYTVGLKADGTVVAVGSNYGGIRDNGYGPCDVDEWKNIIAIHAGWYYTVGLTSGGTVNFVGDQSYSKWLCDNWRGIVAISGGRNHVVGLKADGTVVAVGENEPFRQCDVSGWSDVIEIRASSFSTIGLKADGTVVVVGSEGDRRAEEWTDIIAINAGDHVIGLRADGTVVVVGCHPNNIKYCDICREENWQKWANIRIP